MSKVILVRAPITASEMYGDLAGAGSAEPILGLCYLAANLRKHGFDVEIVDALILKLNFTQAADLIVKKKPRYVGITAVTLDAHHAGRLAKEIKQRAPGIVTIMGGVHITATPQETMSEFESVDIGVLGEGEHTLVELLKALDGKSDIEGIRGLALRRNGRIVLTSEGEIIPELDSLPLPAWDLLPELPRYYHTPAAASNRSPSTSLVTARGCGAKCTFCFQGARGQRVRGHSAAYIMEMIKYLHTKYGIRDIRILDDIFVLLKSRLNELCRMLIKEKLPVSWSCYARVDMVNPEMLKLMNKAKCWQISYGIESGSQKLLDIVKKKVTLGQIERALEWTKKARIRTLGYFMIGFPKETKETIRQTIAFAKRLPLDDFKMNFLTPFPGCELYETADLYGKFNRDWQKMNFYTEPCFVPYGLTKDEIIKYKKQAFREFYLRPRIILSYLGSIRNATRFKALYRGAKTLSKYWRSRN